MADIREVLKLKETSEDPFTPSESITSNSLSKTDVPINAAESDEDLIALYSDRPPSDANSEASTEMDCPQSFLDSDFDSLVDKLNACRLSSDEIPYLMAEYPVFSNSNESCEDEMNSADQISEEMSVGYKMLPDSVTDEAMSNSEDVAADTERVIPGSRLEEDVLQSWLDESDDVITSVVDPDELEYLLIPENEESEMEDFEELNDMQEISENTSSKICDAQDRNQLESIDLIHLQGIPVRNREEDSLLEVRECAKRCLESISKRLNDELSSPSGSDYFKSRDLEVGSKTKQFYGTFGNEKQWIRSKTERSETSVKNHQLDKMGQDFLNADIICERKIEKNELSPRNPNVFAVSNRYSNKNFESYRLESSDMDIPDEGNVKMEVPRIVLQPENEPTPMSSIPDNAAFLNSADTVEKTMEQKSSDDIEYETLDDPEIEPNTANHNPEDAACDDDKIQPKSIIKSQTAAKKRVTFADHKDINKGYLGDEQVDKDLYEEQSKLQELQPDVDTVLRFMTEVYPSRNLSLEDVDLESDSLKSLMSPEPQSFVKNSSKGSPSAAEMYDKFKMIQGKDILECQQKEGAQSQLRSPAQLIHQDPSVEKGTRSKSNSRLARIFKFFKTKSGKRT